MPVSPSLMAGPICQNLFNQAAPLFPAEFGILSTSWLAVTALAMMASLLMLVLVYILASFLRNQQLMTWTKFELFQVLATAVVVLFTSLVIVFGMCSFDMSFLGEPVPAGGQNRYLDAFGNAKNMYQIVDDYFTEVEHVGELLFGYLMYVVKQINFLAKVMWTSSPLGVGSSESPLESLGQLNNLLFIMVSGYVISFLLLHLQMRMLEYLSIAILVYLYPFGVFFRAFEPTRLFGGTLIGLSISLFLFYPIIMVFDDFIVYKSLDASAGELSNKAMGTGALDVASSSYQYSNDEGNSQYVGSEVQRLSQMNADARNAELAGFSSGIAGSLLFLIKPIMLYFIAAVVLPVINFIVLVETTRGITRFFGEEIDITNLTRMI